MLKRFTVIILVFVVIIVMSSCSKKDDKKETAVVEQTSETTNIDTVGSKEETISPGETHKPEETQQDKETAKRDGFVMPDAKIRPYAVMIDNEGTKSLPQGGLDKAQIIYELIVEGGETRLMPLFWNTDPKMIGPVRSSRHYFLDYAMEHNAIYIHIGWSPMAQKDIPKFKINNINGLYGGGEIFWDLTKDKNNWQDSYTSMEKIDKYVKKIKYKTDIDDPGKLQFKYNTEDSESATGEKAENISLKYSAGYKCGFIYDTQTRLYKRFRKDKPHMERVTGEQLTAKNIIIQRVKSFTIKGDKEGRQDLESVGKGEGWYISNGKAVKIKWEKASRSAATKYTDEQGKVITLNPGQTWIQLVPLAGSVTIE